MDFKRLFVNREEMFSLGIEETSGRYYVSFPVSNGLADYEEYYEIEKSKFELFQQDVDAAVTFVNKCRRQEMDELLMQQPGSNRGTAI
jgi:hypothetical protein